MLFQAPKDTGVAWCNHLRSCVVLRNTTEAPHTIAGTYGHLRDPARPGTILRSPAQTYAILGAALQLMCHAVGDGTDD